MKGFTDKEQEIMDKITEAHNLYASLEQTHPSDITEWTSSIHDLQKTLSMRILRRDYPSMFPTHK